MTILYDEEGNEKQLPFKWCICSDCAGNGKSSAYLGAITQGDREPGGAWEDSDQFDDYMRGGYDKPCATCEGTGKVKVVDYDKLDKATKEAWRAQRQADREYEAEVAAERRFGC